MRDNVKRVEASAAAIKPRIDEFSLAFHRAVIGQKEALETILITMINGGHLLLEGVPGVAKTLMATTISELFDLEFKRVQFTPDLIPGDITGTQIFDSSKREFIHRHGPVFTNILLADEINRAPAKVQSSLLEAMQEKQVTIGEKTYKLPDPFLVIATQNPIEQEGTYELPEAQLDRFIFKAKVGYPSRVEEEKILDLYESRDRVSLKKLEDGDFFKELSELSSEIFVDGKLKDYMLDLISSTRDKDSHIGRYIRLGASPRASIYLLRASRTRALLEGRGFVIPEDIKAVLYPLLRHRLILGFDALADGMSPDDVIGILLKETTVP